MAAARVERSPRARASLVRLGEEREEEEAARMVRRAVGGRGAGRERVRGWLGAGVLSKLSVWSARGCLS